ncbi:Conserved_hypothetical protein [Hexamita inflata]|uniref:Uncharacterized protein n=1 Tax=Hexamita inflata TaxID=28002 RepID=A0AA86NHQ6_9EUKA|nr:Conserved hypothetical protein [Hexamita inflata]
MNIEDVNNFRNQIENGELKINKNKTLQSLKFVSELNVRKLVIRHCPNIILDLEDTLTELHIINCKLKYANIKQLKSLELLELSQNTNINIDEISFLTNLKTVDLSDCTLLYVDCLQQLINVQVLILNDNRGIDISGLQNMKQLKELHLADCCLKDIHVLENLPIEELDLSRNVRLNLDPIKHIVSLKILSIWGNQLKDISFMKSLVNLVELDISRNQNVDLTALSQLSNLKSLNICFTGIYDLQILRKLVNLTYLDLSSNNLFDVSELDCLKQLEQINLEGNKIISFKALESNQNFQEFYIHEQLERTPEDIMYLNKLSIIKQSSFCSQTTCIQLFHIRKQYKQNSAKIFNLIEIQHLKQVQFSEQIVVLFSSCVNNDQ